MNSDADTPGPFPTTDGEECMDDTRLSTSFKEPHDCTCVGVCALILVALSGCHTEPPIERVKEGMFMAHSRPILVSLLSHNLVR